MRKFNLLAFILCFFCSASFAFTAGNIVVVRVGDGTGTLSNAAAPVYLDEYTTTGTFVQSVALPTISSAGNHALTLSGSASSEGALTLSADGRYLVLAGYDAATGVASVSSDSTINRTIARVDASGYIDATTGILANTAYKKNNIRGAVSVDGTQFWCAGNGFSNTGGTYYLPLGSFTNSAVQVSTSPANSRTVNIFNNQLYISSASSTFHGISSVGTGVPTTSGQTTTILPGFATATGPSNYAFYFLDLSPSVPGLDVVYVADDRTNGVDGGIYKYSLVSGTWVSNGNKTCTNGLRGIAASKTCSSVNIIASSDSAIYTLVDAGGYNQPIIGTLTTIAASGTAKHFKGIAFAPGTSVTGLTASVSSATNVSCFGGNNGAINISVTGATGTVSYNWGAGITTQNRNNLTNGTYTVTVTDLAGCTDTASATITQPTALSATATPANVTCFGGNNGGITLTATGGTPNYTYNWGGGITSQNRTNISFGNYSVTVTDSKSCTVTANATVTQPSQISVTASITNLPCTGGGNTGAIDITTTGGTPSYTYHWNTNATAEDISSLSAATYTVTITDNSFCSITSSFTVSQAGTLTVTPTSVNVLCHGASTGSVSLSVSGGTPNYTYSWNGGATGSSLSNIAAGTYTVTIADNAGCTLTNTTTITEPTALTATATATDVSCHGLTNGAVSLQVNGGVTGYTYNWGNNVTTQNRSNLGAGSYTVTITDNNSCTATASATVAEPAALTASSTATNASAFGSGDGAVNLTVAGGTSAYTFIWSSGQTTEDISNLSAGNYCVTVTDNHSCTVSDCATVSQPSGISETDLISSVQVFYTGKALFTQVEFKEITSGEIQLFNISGQKLFAESFNNTTLLNKEVEINEMNSGVYILHLNTNLGNFSRKISIIK